MFYIGDEMELMFHLITDSSSWQQLFDIYRCCYTQF